MKSLVPANLRKVCIFVGGSALLCWSVWAFNNDGLTDIAWHDYSSGGTKAWLMSGTTMNSEVALNTADPDWILVGMADFNRDGQLDLLFHHPSSGANGVWYMNGTSRVSAALLPYSAANWLPVGVGYFSDSTDSAIDIVWRNTSDGQNALWQMDNTTLVSASSLPTESDQNWKIGATGDFNRDGHMDLAWNHAGTGQAAYWYMTGISQTSATLIPTASTDWKLVGSGHFDSDAKIDLVWREKTGSGVAYWYMDNTTQLGAASFTGLAQPWAIGGTGDASQDIDGDTLPDLWEKNHIGNLNQSALGDYDADGLTNYQEYQNGTLGGVAELKVKISRPENGSTLP